MDFSLPENSSLNFLVQLVNWTFADAMDKERHLGRDKINLPSKEDMVVLE